MLVGPNGQFIPIPNDQFLQLPNGQYVYASQYAASLQTFQQQPPPIQHSPIQPTDQQQKQPVQNLSLNGNPVLLNEVPFPDNNGISLAAYQQDAIHTHQIQYISPNDFSQQQSLQHNQQYSATINNQFDPSQCKLHFLFVCF